MLENNGIKFELDVDWFLNRYKINSTTTDKYIRRCVDDYLDGSENDIYYNFTVDIIYDYYKKEIDEKRKSIN